MNKTQAMHARAMALKIKVQAEGIVSSMGAIEREDLSDTPPETVKNLFLELKGYWRSMQSVLDDMLGELDEQ